MIPVLLLLLLPGCFSPAPAASPARAYPVPLSLLEVDPQEVAWYREQLARQDLSAEQRRQFEEELRWLQFRLDLQALPTAAPGDAEAGAQYNAAVDALEKAWIESRVPAPTSVPELGILESGIFFEAHVPRRVEIANIWQGYVDGHLTRVYAGRLLPDYRMVVMQDGLQEAAYGAVYAMQFDHDGVTQTALFGTDEETGPLRIVSVGDGYLALASAETENTPSRTFFFGLAGFRLESSREALLQPLEQEPTPLPPTHGLRYP